jgi:hypothetical protein
MEQSSGKKDRGMFSRDDIIGLGQDSFRKNYYPELQKKIMDLERTNARNKALISTIPDLLLVSDPDGNLSPFSLSDPKRDAAITDFLNNPEMILLLKKYVREAIQTGSFSNKEIQWEKTNRTLFFEVRISKSDNNEILVMIRDMTDRITLQRRLVEMAERDVLTGLYNRRSFEEKMQALNGFERENVWPDVL